MKLLVTEREGHAREIIERLSLDDLKHYDGAIAVSLLPPVSQAQAYIHRYWPTLMCSPILYSTCQVESQAYSL